MSYNIQEGGGPRLPLIAQVIRGVSPDVLALLEANDRRNAERLAEELGMRLVYGKANSPYAVAWLSRLPLLRYENHRLATLAKTLLEIEIAWEGATLSLYATHLIAGRTEEGERRKTAETRLILNEIAAHGNRPTVLAGDFNAVHPGDPTGDPPPGEQRGHVARTPIASILEAGFRDCYRALHVTPGYTYASYCPWLRLDSIFASDYMAEQLVACDAVTAREAAVASDHLPIWAEFR